MVTTTKSVDTRARLMNVAENRIRSDGYHAMSFRDLADDLGIKSSSVHYHFRRKEDLVVAVVERYSENFFAQLDEMTANAKTTTERLKALCIIYRAAFTADGHVCLCGVLGAEKNGLPQNVTEAVTKFLTANVNWVASSLGPEMSKQRRQAQAEYIVATLQGALILTKNLTGLDVFDRIAGQLVGAGSKP
ncbi:Transcriptional regulator, AcrR family [hydrothermal vent metagenome]|uniref:Transcriptional regulator, AcrR family n=1 Tax=hydrothermal vent metagenome TaxID=652676 RepID=A0A3B0T1X4_9ZZZZ